MEKKFCVAAEGVKGLQKGMAEGGKNDEKNRGQTSSERVAREVVEALRRRLDLVPGDVVWRFRGTVAVGGWLERMISADLGASDQ
ncbi:hypothetical protein DUI87_21526 [Hirundo rustica rustica]|uniref:Uncharacterized protein n=1 Tax=Hirundo rustica rustica TaxID=333673 RepID=A0A3M0K5I4_HIRRU|nr:hypothetical protein DUI87_21526 [Hirundo rustica rustica]